MDAGLAGNWVQLTIFLGICVGWVGSYLFRVSTKARPVDADAGTAAGSTGVHCVAMAAWTAPTPPPTVCAVNPPPPHSK